MGSMARAKQPLSATHPEVAARWLGNVDELEQRTPDDFGIRARLSCWWWCGEPGHPKVQAPPYEFDRGFRCPACLEEQRAERDRILQLPVSDVPELVAAWRDPRSYEGLKVVDVSQGVRGKQLGIAFRLRCPEDHTVDTVVETFLFVGCPWCRGNATRKSSPPIADTDPEVAATWHPVRNGGLTPQNTPSNYSKPLWWKSVQCCGYEWQATIGARTLGRRPQRGRGHYYCPQCESVFGSLAWLDPETAAEWHEDNPSTPWHVRPTSKLAQASVNWRCSQNPAHVWDTSVSARWNGSGCPQCATSGTSRIEKRFAEAAQLYDAASSPSKDNGWRLDVLVPSLRLIIEYDGAYWHRDKQLLDARKTRELVDRGYLVARVRENELPHLEGFEQQAAVHQVSFSPEFGSAEDAVADLLQWARRQRGITGDLPAAKQVDRTTESRKPPRRTAGSAPPATALWRPATPTEQECFADGCTQTAVFRTRSKPTWCLAHIDEIYRIGGLQRIEDFGHPTSYVLTRCLKCGCEAHYRFEYVRDRISYGEATCRACYWAEWVGSPTLLDANDARAEERLDRAREVAEANGFDLLGPCVGHASYRTKCRRCGKIEADRVGDMGWGCSTCH